MIQTVHRRGRPREQALFGGGEGGGQRVEKRTRQDEATSVFAPKTPGSTREPCALLPSPPARTPYNGYAFPCPLVARQAQNTVLLPYTRAGTAVTTTSAADTAVPTQTPPLLFLLVLHTMVLLCASVILPPLL